MGASRRTAIASAIALASLVAAFPTCADESPARFRTLGYADGLSDDRVWRILRDSRGFVWFGTSTAFFVGVFVRVDHSFVPFSFGVSIGLSLFVQPLLSLLFMTGTSATYCRYGGTRPKTEDYEALEKYQPSHGRNIVVDASLG